MTSFPVLRSLILNTFRAGQITRAMKDVLLIMAARSRPASYEGLANAAGCSRRMVAYAIAQAEALGILERVHHRIRRGHRWMNGKNSYRFIMRAITERLAFPWRRSPCKVFTTGNEDIKKTGRMPHTPEEYRLIFARMDAGMSAQEAGYRGST
ncbi:hypothetical protein K6L44_11545 [Gluconacetobacter entanii]|uniref:hypothetical protein n=1 Tax=Gluconacetobacter entanii TaxID=108528 RepID=UPI001C931DFE|nr:hypothetical protein [Gluconacetobacter entanii]MBY4640608.1 hypothetical protein [Gluconacetobacter entanii]MCW4578953.1 hypothetical protein [Gluconacetobacter entanii]MCW4585736.1 hypothetical protein [Gluconacetobacter entanii]